MIIYCMHFYYSYYMDSIVYFFLIVPFLFKKINIKTDILGMERIIYFILILMQKIAS